MNLFPVADSLITHPPPIDSALDDKLCVEPYP